MKWLIKGGRVVDPASGTDEKLDIIIANGFIRKVEKKISPPKGAEVFDAVGLTVFPGFIDMHCHLREPGFEYKETVETGAAAAVRGGITSIMCMANTDPVNDNASVTGYILEKAKGAGTARVYPVGCVTAGMSGKKLSEMGELADAGCVAVSDDGRPVSDGEIMRRAMAYAPVFNLLVIDHAEDLTISGDGVMHEGAISTRLGLEGIPAAAAVTGVARNIALIKEFGGSIHLAHISTRNAIGHIRTAKAEGLSITAETCPHYFTLTHEAVLGYNTNAKMNPPLRTQDDVQAVIEALADGTIDVIATDHAPHHRDEKEVEFDLAAFGISGLETAMALTLKLVNDGRISLLDAVGKWTKEPARIAGLSGGSIAPEEVADLAFVDLKKEWTVDPEQFVSKGKNTPFTGMTLKGVVTATMVGGQFVFGQPDTI